MRHASPLEWSSPLTLLQQRFLPGAHFRLSHFLKRLRRRRCHRMVPMYSMLIQLDITDLTLHRVNPRKGVPVGSSPIGKDSSTFSHV
jgi:hypothetical protein